MLLLFFFFNDTATTEIYTLSLHDALPIYEARPLLHQRTVPPPRRASGRSHRRPEASLAADRKSTRLNSSHGYISYAVFCLKKKKTLVQTSEHGNSPTADGERGIYRQHNPH